MSKQKDQIESSTEVRVESRSEQTVQGGSVVNDDRVAELTAALQRLQAEFSNFKRRSDESRGELLSLAKQDVILQILPVLDNIDRALAHLPVELADNAWAGGVGQVAKQATDVLKNLGVERFGAEGDEFNPNMHEAIAYEEVAAGAVGNGSNECVAKVMQLGYRMGDKIIRHAIVTVLRSDHPPRMADDAQPKSNDEGGNNNE